MKKEIIQSIKIIIIGMALSAGLAFAQTWNAPGIPPSGNTPVPVNIGASQIKDGALGVGSLGVFGNAGMYGDVSILGPYSSNNIQTISASNLYVSGKTGVGASSNAESLEVST